MAQIAENSPSAGENRLVCHLRRISAILLLLLFGGSLMSPLFGSEEDASLPACCRKSGKHHCSMDQNAGSLNSGPALRGNGRCPSYPGFGAGAAPVIFGVFVATASAFALVAETSSCNSFELRVLSSLQLRAHGKRGPPVSA
jgi:hypothetical protein